MTAVASEPLRVALLGCGVVGTQVARLITTQADDLKARVGRPLELIGIGVRRPELARDGLEPRLFTRDTMALVQRADVDVVIEVIGGIEPARTLILAALEAGKSVVTANKALLAEEGEALFAAAEGNNADLYFEAAVAGAIPIIRPLRESLVGDEITTVMGIVNGTTNFILDKMHAEATSFTDALAQAQALGYAEADPTADVEGYDAAAKAALLAGLAFHTRVRASDVHREGITSITAGDISSARDMNCVVKLLAVCTLLGSGDDAQVSVRVHPAMVPQTHPLAAVSGAYNAVFIESRSAGRLMFLGPGAGGSPTASAVLGDLVTVCRNRVRGVAGPGESTYTHRAVAPIEDAVTRHYIEIDVLDAPGVLATVAGVFAEHGVSLSTVHQAVIPGAREGGWAARLGIMTHAAPQGDIDATVEHLGSQAIVHHAIRVMRVEGLA